MVIHKPQAKDMLHRNPSTQNMIVQPWFVPLSSTSHKFQENLNQLTLQNLIAPTISKVPIAKVQHVNEKRSMTAFDVEVENAYADF